MPDYFHAQFLVPFFVVNGSAADNAVQFLHEEAPRAAFEHGETGVLEALGGRLSSFAHEVAEVLLFVEVVEELLVV